MTDLNTAMMREVFKWLSKYETPPAAADEEWWAGLVREGAEIHTRYPSPLTRHIIFGVIEGQEERYRDAVIEMTEKRRAEGYQIQMDTTYSPAGNTGGAV